MEKLSVENLLSRLAEQEARAAKFRSDFEAWQGRLRKIQAGVEALCVPFEKTQPEMSKEKSAQMKVFSKSKEKYFGSYWWGKFCNFIRYTKFNRFCRRKPKASFESGPLIFGHSDVLSILRMASVRWSSRSTLSVMALSLPPSKATAGLVVR